MSRSKQRRRGSAGGGGGGGRRSPPWGGGGGGGGARRLPPSLTAEDLSDDRRQILAKIRRHQAIKGAHQGQGGAGGGNDDQSTMYDPSVYDPSVYTSHTEGANSAHTDASGGTAGTYGSGGGGGGGWGGGRAGGGGGRSPRSAAGRGQQRRRGSNDEPPDHEGTESVVSALESFMMKAPWARAKGGGGGGDNRTVASAMTFGTNRSGSTGSGSFQPRLPVVAGAQVGAAGGPAGAVPHPHPHGVTEDYALGGGAAAVAGAGSQRRRASARSSSPARDEENQIAEEFITLKKLRLRKFLSAMYLLVSAAVIVVFGFFMVGQKMTLYAAWWPADAGEKEGSVGQQPAAGVAEGAEEAGGPAGARTGGEAPVAGADEAGTSGAGAGAGAGKVGMGDGGGDGGVSAAPERNAGLVQGAPATQQSGRSPGAPAGTGTGTTTGTSAADEEGDRRMAAFEPVVRSVSGDAALDDPSSPQSRALRWLSYEDGFNPVPPPGAPADADNPAIRKLIQRYALVALYYGTGGPASWISSHNFLSPSDECSWNSVSPATGYFSKAGACDGDGRATALALWENGLGGTLTPEIGELTEMRVLSLYGNELRGSVPEEWGRMTKLETLYLHYNSLAADLSPLCRSGWSQIANFRSDCHADNDGYQPVVNCPCCSVCCAPRDGVTGGAGRCYQREG